MPVNGTGKPHSECSKQGVDHVLFLLRMSELCCLSQLVTFASHVPPLGLAFLTSKMGEPDPPGWKESHSLHSLVGRRETGWGPSSQHSSGSLAWPTPQAEGGHGLLFRTCSDSAKPNAAGCCSDCDAPGHPQLAGEELAREPSTAPSGGHLPSGLSLGRIGQPPDAG